MAIERTTELTTDLKPVNTIAISEASSTDTITLSQLPKVTSLASTDLIEIDRNGTGAAVTYATLVDAMTASLGLTGIEETLKRIIG